MLLNDVEIIRGNFISPLLKAQTPKPRGLSTGVSSYGYDLTLNGEWATPSGPIDTADLKATDWDMVTSEAVTLSPGEFVLAGTVEYINMPDNCLGVVFPRSTLARCGVTVMQTLIEPGWRGNITIEIVNHAAVPVTLYRGSGCAQLVFHRSLTPAVTYATRQGKYQDQRPLTVPEN